MRDYVNLIGDGAYRVLSRVQWAVRIQRPAREFFNPPGLLQFAEGGSVTGFALSDSKPGASTPRLRRLFGPDVLLIDWVRSCQIHDCHSGARAIRQWLQAPRSHSTLAVNGVEGQGYPALRVSSSPFHRSSRVDREAIIRAIAPELWAENSAPAESVIGGLAQWLWQEGCRQEAQALVIDALGRVRAVFLNMVRRAMEVKLAKPDVPAFVDQLLGADANYFQDRFCALPFGDFEVSSNGDVHICCPNHLPRTIGNVFGGGTGEEIINSEAAKQVRRSIIEGKFTHCDWMKCPAIQGERLPQRARIADARLKAFIEKGDGEIDGPQDVRLSHDPTCNLWCPSCRKEKIVAKGEQFTRIMEITDRVVRPLLKTAKTVMMNGYGDIFSSRSCRRILESVNEDEHRDLRLIFITNGVLLTESEWAKFPNIHRNVGTIRVSIDAATKETYDKVRLGGDFERLRQNLEFIAGLRREGVIEKFMISFVVQRENFREMEAFHAWGMELGCDHIVFECLMDWNTFAPTEFRRNAVHLPDNLDYDEFRGAARRVRTLPRVSCDFAFA
jgi:uncharacterized Fe-S cluster-containing radical SAM superfamily protein